MMWEQQATLAATLDLSKAMEKASKVLLQDQQQLCRRGQAWGCLA
jgi:hypothetical protein